MCETREFDEEVEYKELDNGSILLSGNISDDEAESLLKLIAESKYTMEYVNDKRRKHYR